jgi:YegS/Rv2252/BmrU family lipid kinase
LDKKTIRFIVNPFSGVSQKQNINELIKKSLDLSLYEYDLIYTEAPMHARELAQQSVKENVNSVIAIGGDGTVNEVAAPLLNTKVNLGIIPGGSGNGFAMHLGIGRNMKKAIRHLNVAKETTIDTCKINDEFYLNLSGVGFDASVAYFTKQSSRRGFKVYFNSAMKEALKYENMHYRIQYDDVVIEDKFLSINVANASMFGYNFRIAPLANLHDGLLDVVMIKDASKARYITSVWRFLNSSLHKSPIVEIIRTKSLIIESNKPMHYHRDGEGAISTDKLAFSINPLSLRLLVPASYSL